MKLGRRLKRLEAMVTSYYDHIWDCCCDHGLLGAALLSRRAASCVHFVDVVPALMQTLETRLQHFFPEQPARWQTHCIDAADLPLQHYSGTQLVIIAGIGGDFTRRMLSAICQANPALDCDFLLCPVHQQYDLRQQLMAMNFGLKSELLLEENRRCYELLLVSTRGDSRHPVSATGQQIWQADNAAQLKTVQRYHHKTLSHYQRMQQGGAKVQHIMDAYRAVYSPSSD